MTESELSRAVGTLLRGADTDLAAVRAVVIRAFNEATGSELDPDQIPSDHEGEAVGRWLREYRFSTEDYVLVAGPIYDGLESKVMRLAQSPCGICGAHRQLPGHAFAVRISPASRQASTTERRRAFASAVRADLEARNIDRYTEPLCLHLVFLLGAGRRPVDVDNLAKGFLDALNGVLYDDDRQIQHLSLLKLTGTGDDEAIWIHAWPTTVNDHRIDTLRRTFEVDWNGAEFLDLEDFIQR